MSSRVGQVRGHDVSVDQPAGRVTRRRSQLTGPVLAAAVVFAVLLAIGILEATGAFSDRTMLWINGIGLLAGGIAFIVSAAVTAFRGPRRVRKAWALLCGAGIAAALTNAWHTVTSSLGRDDLGRFGDIGFVIGGVLSVAGMSSIPAVRQRGLELLRIIMDGVVVAGSVLLTVAVLALPSVIASGENPFARVDAIVLVTNDTILAVVAGFLLIRGDRSDRPMLSMLALGFLSWACTDLARWVLAMHDIAVFTSPVPLGWVGGYAAIAIAGRMPGRTRRPTHPTPENQASPVADTVITFGLLLVAAGANAPSPPAVLSPWIGALWLLLIAAVVIRQVILIADNEMLRRTLERRVHTRTRELVSMTRQSELLLNSVGDGIYGVDARGVVTFANPSAAKILGYSAEELIGRHAHDHFHAAQADNTPYDYRDCYIAESIVSGYTTRGEEDSYLAADGRVIPVEVTSSPLHSGTDSPGAVIVFRDITQRREVDRMKREFVSVVSHELRTPLTAIRGSLGLLADPRLGEIPPQARRMINIALNSSERLGRLVNDILDIDRMESDSMPMDFHDQRAAELVETAVTQLRPIAAEAGVRVSIEPSVGMVYADADRIVQTLVNLVGNAIKFSPEGSVVRVGATRAAAPAEHDPRAAADDRPGPPDSRRHETTGMIIFRVADRGRGIPEDKLEQVFERFEQVDSSDGREMGGSGLGLAICRSIVERHGGSIWADSPAEGGAVFRFTLPEVRGDHDDPDPDESGVDEPGTTTEPVG
ncbi:ATP-binding protein [Microlunatus soli]|uniref:ATP-binding protein n=1 Tax=Microlunatus soli TaxID=630515 RepID=UPI0015606EC6|nr:ATP-binding protein [Microlunatus soli]